MKLIFTVKFTVFLASSGDTESIVISSDSSSSDEEESLVKTTVTRVTNRPKTASTSKTNDNSNTQGKGLQKYIEERTNAKDDKAGTSNEKYETMLFVDRDEAKKTIIESFSSVDEDVRFPSQGTQEIVSPRPSVDI